MLVLNTTITIKTSLQTDWLQYMFEKHIPEVMDTGFFSEHRFFQVIVPEPPRDTVIFSVQFVCRSMEQYRKYVEFEAKSLRADHDERFGDSIVSVERTAMAAVERKADKVTF